MYVLFCSHLYAFKWQMQSVKLSNCCDSFCNLCHSISLNRVMDLNELQWYDYDFALTFIKINWSTALRESPEIRLQSRNAIQSNVVQVMGLHWCNAHELNTFQDLFSFLSFFSPHIIKSSWCLSHSKGPCLSGWNIYSEQYKPADSSLCQRETLTHL